MSTAQAGAAAAAPTESGLLGAGLLDRIVEESRIAQSEQEKSRARDIIGELVNQVLEGEVVVSENLAASIDARVAELDRLISEQLSEIMHAPEFQALESAWTGLHYLCRQTSTGAHLKIKLLNAGKRELVKDFKSAIDFDQSALFKKVYEEEFGTFGGAPFGALIGQFEISRQPEDMYFIDQMSHVAAAAHAPFITAAAPQLFGLESFLELGKPRDMGKVFDTVEYAKWKSFRESEDARYVGLALPRFLGRLPYNPLDGLPTEGFNFVEEVDGSNHDKYLWCNAAFALAARLTDAFDTYGWCAAIRGVESNGMMCSTRELELGDDLVDDDDQHGAADRRQGDRPERTPAAGVVEGGRLVGLDRDLVQAGDEQDHVEADLQPQPDRAGVVEMPEVGLVLGGDAAGRSQALVGVHREGDQAHHQALLGLGGVPRQRQAVVGIVVTIHVGDRQVGFVDGGADGHRSILGLQDRGQAGAPPATMRDPHRWRSFR